MNIAIGSDHAGFEAKQKIKGRLEAAGHTVLDMGPDSDASVDYPDYAEKVGRWVAGDEARKGILVCGTGIGIGIAANKIRGVRAATIHDDFTAQMCREHNDANVACIGARVVAADSIPGIVDRFLTTEFGGGRHSRRVGKIDDLDHAHACDDGDE